MITRARLRSQRNNAEIVIMEELIENFLKVLENPQVVDRMQLIIQPLYDEKLSPVVTALQNTMENMQQTIYNLRDQLKAKDNVIASLQKDVSTLEARTEEVEQYSRRGAIRVFGVPENTPNTTDEVLLDIFNNKMKLDPPLSIEDIEVSHRVGRLQSIRTETTVPEGSDGNGGGDGRNSAMAASTVKPRAIIAKLLSRRTKTRIMDNRKKLKQYYQSNPGTYPIYVSDDLTKKNANLAFQARRLKTLKHISDTFVTNSKVFIKDNHGHIKQITSQMDIDRYA